MFLSTSLNSPHFLFPTKPKPTKTFHQNSTKSHNPPTKTPPTPLKTTKNRPLQPPRSKFKFHTLNPINLSDHLKSCSNLKQTKCVHAVAIRSFLTSDNFMNNNLIAAYSTFSGLSYAKKLFDRMTDKNVVTWTTILNGCLKHGLDDVAMSLFEELVCSDSGVECNSFTYVCLLKLCGNRCDFELGRQIHARVVTGSWSNLKVDSTLVYFYAQCGDLDGASRVFKGMEMQDVVSWTTVISAYAQNGLGHEAFSMFARMQREGLSPNEFTLCSALKACGKEKELRFGKQLHGAIVKGVVREDVVVGSSLVTMYGNCGEVSDARLVFDLMPKRNTVTWSSMISGYARNGMGKEAISLFHSMKRRRIFMNDLTIVSTITACGWIECLKLGKELHGQILKKRLQSNAYIDSTLIWLYCKYGEYYYAARILEAMPEKDAISWTAMISGQTCFKAGSESLRSLNEMLIEGVEPTAFTYSAALKACAKGEQVRCGEFIHGLANKTSDFSNVFVGSALIDMYAKCGRIKEAIRVFETMPNKNLVSWNAMIVGYAKNGYRQEAMNLMYRMRAEHLYVDDFVLTTVLNLCGDVHSKLD